MTKKTVCDFCGSDIQRYEISGECETGGRCGAFVQWRISVMEHAGHICLDCLCETVSERFEEISPRPTVADGAESAVRAPPAPAKKPGALIRLYRWLTMMKLNERKGGER